MGTYNQLLKKGVKKKERKYQKDYSHKKSQEVTKSAMWCSPNIVLLGACNDFSCNIVFGKGLALWSLFGDGGLRRFVYGGGPPSPEKWQIGLKALAIISFFVYFCDFSWQTLNIRKATSQSEVILEVLFRFLSERYERKSLMITSNLVFSEWDKIFKDPVTTAAAIDRLIHHSIILELDGASYRAQYAKTKKEKK